MMKTNLLKYRNPEVLDGLFGGIGQSLEITFHEQELGQIKTFGDLCDLVYSKMPLEKVALCTTQQAFYRLRSEIASSLGAATERITPNSKLETLFPRDGRRELIKRFERSSGLSILYLKPKRGIVTALVLLLTASTATLFVSGGIGLTGLLTGVLGFCIAARTGKEFACETVGEAASIMAQEQYWVWQTNPNTINHMEVEGLIRKTFCEQFAFEPTMLTREANF